MMKAMILAAGRGERMQSLTDNTPKPLLKANGKPLIEYTLLQLAENGFTDIVINLAYLGKQISDYLGNGQHFGVNIEYSHETEGALETAGGIAHALPLLGSEPFIVINSDIACDYPLSRLHHTHFDLAHLVLIRNPPHHPEGDFHLAENGKLADNGNNKLTFSGIGLYKPELFKYLPTGKSRLAPLFRQYMPQQQISGEYHQGLWMDIGTPQRLGQLETYYQRNTIHTP